MWEHPLKTYRLSRGFSMDAMAERAKTTKSTLSRIEAGLLRPTHDLMLRLAKATDNAVTIEAMVRAAAELREGRAA